MADSSFGIMTCTIEKYSNTSSETCTIQQTLHEHDAHAIDNREVEVMSNSQKIISPLHGAIAGFAGTLPMTVFMLSTQRFLPKGQRYDLPPEIITKDITERAHIRQHMNKAQILAATTAAHFGYGAGMGMLYGILARRIPFNSALKGILFSLVIWAVSYQMLLPVIGIKESAQGETMQRNLMMIVAHIIWGASTGVAADSL
jgi:putative membrane protein